MLPTLLKDSIVPAACLEDHPILPKTVMSRTLIQDVIASTMIPPKFLPPSLKEVNEKVFNLIVLLFDFVFCFIFALFFSVVPATNSSSRMCYSTGRSIATPVIERSDNDSDSRCENIYELIQRRVRD